MTASRFTLDLAFFFSVMKASQAVAQFDHYPADPELGRLIGDTGCASRTISLLDTADGFEIAVEPVPAGFAAVWMAGVVLLVVLFFGQQRGWKQGIGLGVLSLIPSVLIVGMMQRINQVAADQGPWLRYRTADQALKIAGLGEPVQISPQTQELVFVAESKIRTEDAYRTTQLLLLQPRSNGWQAVRLWHATERKIAWEVYAEALARQVAQRLGLKLRSIEILQFV